MDEEVALSEKSHIPKVVLAATIVSLGTIEMTSRLEQGLKRLLMNEKKNRGGRMKRTIAAVALLCSTFPLRAETVLNAAAAGCTRVDLQSIAGKYLDALNKGNPSLMPLSQKTKYIENTKEIPIGQGIWQAPLAVDFHRSLLDTDICETFSEIIHTSSNHPYVLGTRLKVLDNRIAEIESLVTDKDDWLFNAENYLKYSSQEKWDILPVAQRSDRQTLINAANAYFDVFSDRSSKVPWGIPCARIEGGMYTNPNGDPNASCTGGPPLEGIVKIVNRRFIVDEDMGAVVGLMNFGSETGLPDSHIFRLENGKIRYVHTLTVCTIPDCGFPPPKEKVKPQ